MERMRREINQRLRGGKCRLQRIVLHTIHRRVLSLRMNRLCQVDPLFDEIFEIALISTRTQDRISCDQSGACRRRFLRILRPAEGSVKNVGNSLDDHRVL